MVNIEAGTPTVDRDPHNYVAYISRLPSARKVWNSQISHPAGVQFTIFPSQTIELANHSKDENAVRKTNRRVPAFHLRASVRCQVSGTEAETKANKEKTVKTRLTAGILEV